MSAASDALKAQIAADPRVQQLARSRAKGSIPGIVTAAELREMGYPVTDNGWKYTTNLTPRNTASPNPGVFDESSTSDKVMLGVGAGMLGWGGAGLAGVGPLAGGTSATSAGFIPPELAGTGIIPGVGAGGGAGYAPSAGGGGILGGLRKVGEVLTGGKKLADQASGGGGFDWTKLIPLGLGTAAAIRGATRGPTQSEQAMQKMLASAQSRVDAQEPIFQALTAMAKAQMPDFTKGQ